MDSVETESREAAAEVRSDQPRQVSFKNLLEGGENEIYQETYGGRYRHESKSRCCRCRIGRHLHILSRAGRTKEASLTDARKQNTRSFTSTRRLLVRP
ncbi:hypothetical protein MPTK1_3g08130 [Marchantia polymorpha subsp. ruderalis]|uniref:Uncharacterized protein n=2 Tax=Marchantia polymorpha TaxID=3197 RepID=A0AAF6AYL1_MARPO|nr:hypothetical protein MARPO_0006s0288 [Marchantia polymorpha]BBN04845.1 hypothetical protein Mp_3g08130 [Marchantia polymorpha subsp. ruderalis]|eukprot:PTQ48297.1 hypothetical protein MARPO_0006s0288 [Marchantia polymorpha]